ncbi:uncharacterized protein LOC144232274 [Crocuta crocuta]
MTFFFPNWIFFPPLGQVPHSAHATTHTYTPENPPWKSWGLPGAVGAKKEIRPPQGGTAPTPSGKCSNTVRFQRALLMRRACQVYQLQPPQTESPKKKSAGGGRGELRRPGRGGASSGSGKTEIPEPALSPGKRGPVLSPGQVSADIILLLPVSFSYQQKSFPFATKTRLHPKVSHKLKREKRNIDNCYTEEPTNLQQHQGVKQQQRQIQAQLQRRLQTSESLPSMPVSGQRMLRPLLSDWQSALLAAADLRVGRPESSQRSPRGSCLEGRGQGQLRSKENTGEEWRIPWNTKRLIHLESEDTFL